MPIRRRQYVAEVGPLNAVSAFTPAAWFEAPPVDLPKRSRRPPQEPEWVLTAINPVFTPAAWFEAPPPERSAYRRLRQQEESWQQAPRLFTNLFGATEPETSRQRRPPKVEDPPWAQALLSPTLSSAGFLVESPFRPTGPSRRPFADGGAGGDGTGTVEFIENERAALARSTKPRPPTDAAFTLPSAFPFAPVPAGFLGEDAARVPRRARARSEDVGPATILFFPEPPAPPVEPERKAPGRRAQAEDVVPASVLFFSTPPILAEDPAPRRPPRRLHPSGEERSPGAPFLYPSFGWDLDPEVPVRRLRRPGEDVRPPGDPLVFLPLPWFNAPEPGPRYRRPMPGDTAGPVGAFTVQLSASALDDQPGRVPRRPRPPPGETAGPVGSPLVVLLPFFEQSEAARARGRRVISPEEALVLPGAPFVQDDQALVRRRLRFAGGETAGPVGDPVQQPSAFVPGEDAARAAFLRRRPLEEQVPGAPLFVAAPWADLAVDPLPRPRRQGHRAPSWSSWPEATFVPPVFGPWADLVNDPLGRGTVVQRDLNPEWAYGGVTPLPSPSRPLETLFRLGLHGHPACQSLFSLSLQQVLRELAGDDHARSTSGAGSFSSLLPVALPLGGLSSVRFLAVEVTQGSLVLVLATAASGAAALPLRGPMVWRAPLGGAPVVSVALAGTGSARWLLAGD